MATVEAGVSVTSAFHILIQCLVKRKVCKKWTQHVQNNDQCPMQISLYPFPKSAERERERERERDMFPAAF
jgi:hypothetical protein